MFNDISGGHLYIGTQTWPHKQLLLHEGQNRHQTIGCSSTVETPKIMGLEFSPHLGLYHNFSGWLQYHDTMLIAISSAKKAPPSGIPSPSRNWMRTVVRAIEGWKPTHLGFCSRQRAEFWSYWKWWFIVDFPIKKWWFSIAMLVYQRVHPRLAWSNMVYSAKKNNKTLYTCHGKGRDFLCSIWFAPVIPPNGIA